LYGKAGAFRPKPYGAEYRTLSSFWIFSEPLREWAYRGIQRAVESTIDLPGDKIQECINNGDEELAKALVNEFSLEVL
jgi:hypothetical protein